MAPGTLLHGLSAENFAGRHCANPRHARSFQTGPLVPTVPRHAFSRFSFSPYSRPSVAVQRTKGSSLSNGGRVCPGHSTPQCLVARLVRSFSTGLLPLTPSTSSSSGCRFGSWGPCGGPAGGGYSGASRAPSCSFRQRRSSAWSTGANEALPPERKPCWCIHPPILDLCPFFHDCDDGPLRVKAVQWRPCSPLRATGARRWMSTCSGRRIAPRRPRKSPRRSFAAVSRDV